MNDLIERLRMLGEIAGIEGGCIGDAAADALEAKDAEIERLRDERDWLKKEYNWMSKIIDKLPLTLPEAALKEQSDER